MAKVGHFPNLNLHYILYKPPPPYRPTAHVRALQINEPTKGIKIYQAYDFDSLSVYISVSLMFNIDEGTSSDLFYSEKNFQQQTWPPVQRLITWLSLSLNYHAGLHLRSLHPQRKSTLFLLTGHLLVLWKEKSSRRHNSRESKERFSL